MSDAWHVDARWRFQRAVPLVLCAPRNPRALGALALLSVSLGCSAGERTPGTGPGFYRLRADQDAGVTDDTHADTGNTDAGGETHAAGGGSAIPVAASCGDGVVDELTEECDGLAPVFRGCSVLGYQFGVLTCTGECTWDYSACEGTEDCSDGRDNDGDGAIDCADDEDCQATCVDPCAAPELLGANASTIGTTVGRKAATPISCGSPEGAGASIAYEVVAEMDGRLDLELNAEANLTLSVRSECASMESELACRWPTRVTLDVTVGQRVFAIVSGHSAEDSGEFILETRQREPACGDAIREIVDVELPDGYKTEACDDGNFIDGDGCDDCRLESTETEPNNDEPAEADPFVAGERMYAELFPAGDVDHFTVELPDDASTLVVGTAPLGDGSCAHNLADSLVEIFTVDDTGAHLLTDDDDGGEGRCAQAVASGLEAGVYTVRVRTLAKAYPLTFPYRLAVSIGVCGDGAATLGEECDDGNRDPDDGCDGKCRTE